MLRKRDIYWLGRSNQIPFLLDPLQICLFADLQFQIVFMKGSSPTSPSSPEDDTKTKVFTK